MKLQVVPLTLKQANSVVLAWHRHHKPVKVHRYSIGVRDEKGYIHGAAIMALPVARLAGNMHEVVEVTRMVSDGTPNVCSMLYGAAARAAKALGFQKIQTYILDTELGTSLKASGWVLESYVKGKKWVRYEKGQKPKERLNDFPTIDKQRWVLLLKEREEMDLLFPQVVEKETDDPTSLA